MADQPAADPMAAATSSLMSAIQGYVNTAVAVEMANREGRPQTDAALQARLDAAVQENSELMDKIKQIESKKTTRSSRKQERDAVKSVFSNYLGVAIPDSKLSRALRTPTTKFAPFQKLPVELRMKIWKLALPGGRVFDLSMTEGHFTRLMRLPTPHNAVNNNGVLSAAQAQRQASGLADMCVSSHKTPKLRLACKEADRAFKEAGGFEFGLFGGAYKGLWFNYAEDILFIRDEPRAWTNLDMSRIPRVAMSHSRFMNKADCVGKLDMILDHFTSCREVLLVQTMEWDIRSCLANHRAQARLFPLEDNNPVSCHDYPKELSAEIGNVAAWKDVKRVVEHLWKEHVVEVKRLPESRIPRFKGVDMIRGRPSYFD